MPIDNQINANGRKMVVKIYTIDLKSQKRAFAPVILNAFLYRLCTEITSDFCCGFMTTGDRDVEMSHNGACDISIIKFTDST